MEKTRQRVPSGSPYEPLLGSSRAVRVGNTVVVTGTAPIGKDGQTVGPGDPATQARRCLEIVREALEGLEVTLADVIRTRILLTRISDWEDVAKVYGEYFSDIRSVTTVMQVLAFTDPEWLVEIEVDAMISGQGAR